jgi:hypothetical protein
MTTKEEEFKQRFVAVLQDLQSNGRNDVEAMWLLGSLAAALVDKARQPSWSTLKANLTREAYDGLLRDFQAQGNTLHQQGKAKHAWAIQILGISLVARTQLDEQVQAGAALLDEIIGYAVAVYRKSAPRGNTLN